MLQKFIVILVFCAIHMNVVNSETSFQFHSLEFIMKFSSDLNLAIHRAIESSEITNDFIKSIATTSNEDIVLQLNNLMIQVEQRLSLIREKHSDSSVTLRIDRSLARILGKIMRQKEDYENLMKHLGVIYNNMKLQVLENLSIELTDDATWRDLNSLFHEFKPMVPSLGEYHFLDLYTEYVETKEQELCGDERLPNTYLYGLYTLIVSTEMMGLLAINFKFGMLHKVFNRDFNATLLHAQTARMNRLEYYYKTFKEAMEHAPWNVRACDPPQNIRNKTFYEMENLYQDILINEFGNNHEDSCRGGCDTIHLKNFNNCKRVFDCWSVVNPTYCELESTRKRYLWLEDGNKQPYGQKTTCPGNIVSFRWTLYWGYFCEKCWCICEGSSLKVMEEKPQATHVFSLLPSESNITNNMVVIGIRFVVKEGIVHIQVKEGRLGVQGLIMEPSQSWKNNPDMRSSVIKAREGLDDFYQSGRDFIVIDEYTNAINLDDVIVPHGRVVTGIKFSLAQKGEVSDPWQRLEIQVQHTRFDFASGILDHSSEPQWMSSTENHRRRLYTHRLMSSELSAGPNWPTESLDSYVSFGPSNGRTDMGQTTIPFLDAVAVDTISSALSGIGLFHKGSPGYGGFLSFRLHCLNITQYML